MKLAISKQFLTQFPLDELRTPDMFSRLHFTNLLLIVGYVGYLGFGLPFSRLLQPQTTKGIPTAGSQRIPSIYSQSLPIHPFGH